MATMCGNGARCLARYALSSGFEGPEVAFATDAGPYRARLQDDASEAGAGEDPMIRLYVPDAQRMQRDVPLAGDLPPGVIEADFVWTGTEHLVLFVEDAEAWPDDEVARWGERLRHDEALAPEGANANFVSASSTESGQPVLHVRTFEKGVEAETLSCGTGVLAAVAAARERGRANGGPVDVVTCGGRLRVGTETSSGAPRTYLEGPVETVFRGTLEMDGS
jgi:diaminopimelate epimerase